MMAAELGQPPKRPCLVADALDWHFAAVSEIHHNAWRGYQGMLMRFAQAVLLRGLLSLTAATPQQVSLAQAQPPTLIDIVPGSGPAGKAYPLEATIRGTGFLPTGNVVEFGPVKIPDLPSAGGVRITFSVPKLVSSGGEVPPMVLPGGDYRVTGTTPAGPSNGLMFRLPRFQ